MADKPFEQRIIHTLERPTSLDLNLAQSQINSNHRALLRWMYEPNSGIAPNGCIGDSFEPVGPSPSGTTVTLRKGIAISAASLTSYPSGSPIDGIPGLIDTFNPHIMFLSADKTISIPAGPALGLCRRDLIAIRPMLGDEKLTDSTTTDIYDPALNYFSGQTKPKTLTEDLYSQVPQVISYTGTPTDPIVYVTGQEVAYSTPDDFLSAPLPVITAPGYIYIAVINRGGGPSAPITPTQVADWRRMVAPYGNMVISGSAVVGSDGTNGPGSELSNVVINTPPGVSASIYKAGFDEATQKNTYVLAVFGPRAITGGNSHFAVGTPQDAAWAFNRIYPTIAIAGEGTINNLLDDAAKTIYADSAKSSPTVSAAIGTPVHYFPFSVGTVENVLDNVTYEVSGTEEMRKLFFNAGTSVSGTGLPAETYSLGSSVQTATTGITKAMSGAWERIAGFVTPAGLMDGITVPTGYWELPIIAASQSDDAAIRVRLYSYDGSTNPESGTLIAEGNCALPFLAGSGGAGTTSTCIAYLPIDSYSLGTNRIYVKVECNAPSGNVYFYFGRAYPSHINTDIPQSTPTVIVPTVQEPTRLNLTSEQFQKIFLTSYKSVPVGFVVNLQVAP